MQYGANDGGSEPKGEARSQPDSPAADSGAGGPFPREILGGVPPMLILAAASGVMAILLIAQMTPSVPPPPAPMALLVPAPVADAGPDAGEADAATEVAEEPSSPPAWRVSDLAKDTSVELIDGTMQRRTLLNALTSTGIAKGEVARIEHAFDGVRTFDDAGQKDAFAVARDKATGSVVAFEYSTSPFDVWQARTGDEDAGAPFVGKKLDLHVDKKHVAVGIAIGEDLRASIVQSGLDDDMLPLLDDALDGHAELSDLRPGARLRLLAVEDRVGGTFVKYEALEAVEYTPALASGDQRPLRVYYFGKAPTTTWLARSQKQAKQESAKTPSFFYDAKGRQPMQGGWKSPVPFTRIASRFNPKRMHPVLHVIMPHNGVDFAAPPGTPVYSTAEGTVKSVGGGGPCGNMVQITHANNYTSAYCHMSRFAAGLHAGQHVEARQLVGYVGATGRTTGPHLHFAVKHGDAFIDPLALKLDGVRVVPLADRADFERDRAELDLALDAITLPLPPAGTDAGVGTSTNATYDAGSDEVFEEGQQ